MAAIFRQIWETIAEDLKQAIIRGELKGGQRLRIEELSRKYGVSNTPIRDALRYLANLGFVENIPRRMVIVRKITLKEIEEIYAIQGALEGLAAGLAVQHCTEKDIESLTCLLDQMEKLVAQMDVEGYSRADVEFHSTIVRLSGNERLIKMVDESRDHIARFRFIRLRKPDLLRGSLSDHRRIVSALRTLDADAVSREMKDHVVMGAEPLKQMVSQGGEG